MKRISEDALATRKEIVRACQWGNGHQSQIFYSQEAVRGAWLEHQWRYHLPMSLDCSSWATYCCWVSGAPDPSGYNYHAVGNSDSIYLNALKHGLIVPLAKARMGDLAIFGGTPNNPYDAHHVSVLMQTPSRFMRRANTHRLPSDSHVSSHGSMGGPVKMTLHSEIDWEPNYHIVQTVPDNF